MKYNVLCGSDRLASADHLLKDRRIGLLTAASGVDQYGIPTYYKLNSDYHLTVLFAPEHGIHSVLQDGGWQGSFVDKETGVPVYDLPAKGNPDIDKALSLCDIVLYDIQDVGARFYTYVYCLTYLMTECAKRNIPVLILDRPNPICGEMSVVSGAILDEERYSSFVGRYALPVRYSLTCGEFANYINIVKQIGCELHVIECQGWSRSMYADETCLPWINPSPNIPGVNCAINYIGTCLIEATNVSEGRGTTRPFDIIGAPFINSYDLCQSMNSAPLEGVRFSRSFFTPMFGKYQGSACEGVQINIIDKRFYNPHATGLYLLSELCKYSEFEWKENGICLRYGTDALTVNKHFDPQAVLDSEKSGINRYIKEVSEFLIYQ